MAGRMLWGIKRGMGVEGRVGDSGDDKGRDMQIKRIEKRGRYLRIE